MKNKDLIYKILNLEKGEGVQVFLPMLYSFFSGASLAFFVTASTSLFLNIFDRDMLSVAFIASGIIVWIAGQIFSVAQRKYDFTKNLKSSIGLLLLSIIVFIIFLKGSRQLVIVFIIYAWIRIFAYIHAVTFWGMAGRMFTLRQGKRVFGLISGGEVLASIISFFSVPFLLKIAKTEDLLIISCITLFIAFLILFIIAGRYKDKLRESQKKSSSLAKPLKKTSFLQNRYYRLFFAIAFIPIFAQFFIDFIFQAQAKIEYPGKADLTAFVGIFFGIGSIIEFILKTFISGRLMARYGMKFALLAFPVMLLFSVTLSTAFGFIYGAFSLFFSFVALGRLFTRAVRTSFNDPATQILFQPLPPDERISFQNKVESGPKAFASIAAGIFLFLFAKIPGFSLVYFSAFLLLVIIFWYRSAVEIYKEYRKELQSILTVKKDDLAQEHLHPLLKILLQKIESENNRELTSLIKFCRLLFPYESDNLIKQNDKIIQMPDLNNSLKFNHVIELSKSEDFLNRIIAARHLSEYSIYKIEKPLVRLLHDENFDVKCEAAISAGKMKETELFYHLVTLLQNPVYANTVTAALIHIGDPILTDLDQEFQKTEYDIAFQLKIIKLVEKIGTERSIGFLRRNLNHPNNLVSNQVIKSLGKLQYRSNRNESTAIWEKIENEIKYFVYVSSAIVNLSNSSMTKEIIVSLEREKSEKKQKIFSLLSVLYEPFAIFLIANNIEGSDKEARGFALEIADMIISDYHKPLLIPLLENEPDNDLINKYQFYYPSEKLELIDQLIDILNTEYWVISLYIKALCLKTLALYNDVKILPSLIVNMVHPHPIVRQQAAFCLYQKDKFLFEREISKIHHKVSDIKVFANEITNLTTGFRILILDKLKLLKNLRIFINASEEKLIDIATSAKEIFVNKDNQYKYQNTPKELLIIVEGDLIAADSGAKFETGAILSAFINPDIQEQTFIALGERVILFSIELFLINDLIVNNLLFADDFGKMIWKDQEDNTLQQELSIAGTINDTITIVKT